MVKYHQMKIGRFARLILQPTPGGFLGIIGLALFIMLFAGLSYATHHNLFYEYLFGSGSSVQLIETSRSTVAVFNETIFGNSVLNKILFFIFWMVVGLVVYLVVTGFSSGLSIAERALEELRFVHAERQRITSELSLRLVLLFIALGLGVIYGVFMYQVLVPFGILCARIVAGDMSSLNSWMYGFLGFIVIAGSLYLGMVLLRFILLRPRIFSNVEDIVSDEIEHGEE